MQNDANKPKALVLAGGKAPKDEIHEWGRKKGQHPRPRTLPLPAAGPHKIKSSGSRRRTGPGVTGRGRCPLRRVNAVRGRS